MEKVLESYRRNGNFLQSKIITRSVIDSVSTIALAAAYRINAVTQLLENIAFREEISSDAVVLHDFARLLAIPLRDGCDLMDVIGRRIQPSDA
ncbi:hypothetical protein JFV30_09665 [Pseudomonas sp. TH32]|uniref:hypothetical protein n=1 Tax=unclassified Pseudomonas TaxID=196821 RepID=UPI00191195C4|nr:MULTISPECIES: hypothetical protein [unclassified Pseudomonas]MBK5437102.1 hypothetical protein [Pseudomonas sp. TH32]MDF3198654.1 hypothetical protein [Pseudomonas sp. 1912-s]